MTSARHPGAGGPPTRVRHGVLGMLFVTVVINYLDRSNLSVAALALTGALSYLLVVGRVERVAA